jgi:hypothetical protein
MKKLKSTYTCIIYDHSDIRSSSWKRYFRNVERYYKKYLGIRIKFTLEKRDFKGIVWNKPTYITSDRTGKKRKRYYANKYWFRHFFTKRATDYNFCGAFFTEEQWLRGARDNTLRGWSIDLYEGVSEFMWTGSTRKSYRLGPKDRMKAIDGRMAHELAHCIPDHILEMPQFDLTHIAHYDGKNMAAALAFLKEIYD